MPILTLNFSLKAHSKVNVYVDGSLQVTAKGNEQVKITVEKGHHRFRLVQYRGRSEGSAATFGAVPYFAGGTLLNGDGTKSPHLLPWRATAYYCESEFSADVDSDGSVAILSSVEKKRSFIGVDDNFICLRIGTVQGVNISNLTVSGLNKTEMLRFYRWQRLILLLTYLPVFALAVWQLFVALLNLNEPIMFGVIGKYYVLLPILIFSVMLFRIFYFLLKLKKAQG